MAFDKTVVFALVAVLIVPFAVVIMDDGTNNDAARDSGYQVISFSDNGRANISKYVIGVGGTEYDLNFNTSVTYHQ